MIVKARLQFRAAVVRKHGPKGTGAEPFGGLNNAVELTLAELGKPARSDERVCELLIKRRAYSTAV